MKHLLIWIGAFVFVSLMPVAAQACSCLFSSAPCQTYWNTPAVFTGMVMEVEDIRIPVGGDMDVFMRKKRIHFSVKESFRGNVSGIVEIATGSGGGDCGYNFEQGKSYIVYAGKNDAGELTTGICTRTRPIEEAKADLDYIHGLDKMKPVATFSGGIQVYRPRRSDEEWTEESGKSQPLSGVTVYLSNASSKFEAKTKKDGTFRFEELPPGEFQLKIPAPPGYWPKEINHTFTLHSKGCFETGFSFELDSSISGRVLKPDGTPASKIMIHMVPVEQIDLPHQPDPHFAETDDGGRFVLRGLTPGSYYLGVRLLRITMSDFPYPRTFYPGVAKLDEAAVVNVIAGRPQPGLEFQLPQPLKTRKIQGIVLMADGKPAKNYSVFTKDIEYSRGGMGDGMGVEIGTDGKFSIIRPDGIAYAIYAYTAFPDGNQMHAEPISVPSEGAQEGLKLIINQPGGSCEKCRR
jgi:hypothetical protein